MTIITVIVACCMLSVALFHTSNACERTVMCACCLAPILPPSQILPPAADDFARTAKADFFATGASFADTAGTLPPPDEPGAADAEPQPPYEPEVAARNAAPSAPPRHVTDDPKARGGMQMLKIA